MFSFIKNNLFKSHNQKTLNIYNKLVDKVKYRSDFFQLSKEDLEELQDFLSQERAKSRVIIRNENEFEKNVEKEKIPKAISILMLAGIVSSFLGITLANYTKNLVLILKKVIHL